VERDGLRGRRRAAVLAAGTGGVLAYYVGPHAAGLAHVVTRVTENGPDFQVWGGPHVLIVAGQGRTRRWSIKG